MGPQQFWHGENIDHAEKKEALNTSKFMLKLNFENKKYLFANIFAQAACVKYKYNLEGFNSFPFSLVC